MKIRNYLCIAAVVFSCLVLVQTVCAKSDPWEKDLARGARQLKSKDYERAVASFTSALRINPELSDAYLSRAAARVELKDYDGALKDYDQAIRINPNVIENYLRRGDLDLLQGNMQAAVDDYGQALRLNPQNASAHLLRAKAFEKNGDYDRAVQDYSAIVKSQPDSIQAREDRAKCKVRAHDYDAAADDYNFLLKKYKQRVFPLNYELGEVLQLQGQKDAAKEHFDQVITYYSKSLGKSKKSGSDYIRRGLAYHQLGDSAKALSDLENAVSLLPGDVTARANLGHIRLAAGDTAGAIKDLNAALKIDGHLYAALSDRAAAYALQGDFRAARRDLDAALAMEKDADGLLNRAVARTALGDIDGIADAAAAKKLNPKSFQQRQQQLSDMIAAKEGRSEKDVELAQDLEALATLELADSNADSAEKLVKRALEIQEKKLNKNDPKLAYSLLMLGKIYMEKQSLVKAETLFRSALSKLANNADGDQKYAVFNLEDLAAILIRSSSFEEAGSVLSDTRMVRASTGLSERLLSEEMTKQAEHAIDAYKQKKKYEQQEELLRKMAKIQAAPPVAEETAEPKKVINQPIRDKWALIVGISQFKDSKINLHYASKDAKDFYNFLIKENNFAPDHVQLLTDGSATRANILSLLGSKWLPRVAEPNDLVVIYFSSHGSPSSLDVGGVNYLVAYDTDVSDLYATGIAMQDLARIIKERVHCDRIICLLDACHSGGASPSSKGLTRTGNVDVEKIVQGTGQLVISSSQPDQRSWESSRYDGSVFTKHLIDGLRKNGRSTKLGEAFSYLESETQREVLRDRGVMQSPVMKSRWQGDDLIIGVPPASPSPGLTGLDLPDAVPEAAPAAPAAKSASPPVKAPASRRGH